MGIAGVGITSDLNHLIERAYDHVTAHLKIYGTKPPSNRVMKKLSEYISANAISPIRRVFGIKLCLFDISDNKQPCIQIVGPSGLVSQSPVICLGINQHL